MNLNSLLGHFSARYGNPFRKRISVVLNSIFSLDYRYVTRNASILCGIGAPAELFYYWYESSKGFWDSLIIRFLLVIAFLSLTLVDWKKVKGWLPILHWEIVLFLVIPFQSTWSMLQNGVNEYYHSSQIMMFVILGMLTKVWMVPIHLLFGCGAVSMVFFWRYGWDPKLFSDSMDAQVLSLFGGIVSSAIMLVLESYHKKITNATLALAKAEDEKQKALELAFAFEELKSREELIRIYVRPSLVDEIRAGKNPSEFQPIITNLAIMFCDIRDFTQLTEVLNPYERQTFLNQYFSMMTHPIVRNGGEVDKIMGDCVMGVFANGAQAVQASIDMRLELQNFNQKMFDMGQPKIRNGIGIAKGDVMQGNFGSFEKLDRTVIGEAVNIAARLEAKTKMYNLEVIVTEDVIRDLPLGATHYRWIDLVQVKGSTRHLKLYEIYGHQPIEVRRFKDETRDLLEKALTIYFQKGFKDASRLFKAMLDRVPPHRLIPNDLMDNLLRYYIAHCDVWINDHTGTWEQIEKWEGVHIFYEK
jgi:class 3 adenylate cyclase